MLTQDVDLIILQSLTLSNLKSICSTDSYFNRLCHDLSIINKLNAAEKQTEHVILLIPNNRFQHLIIDTYMSFDYINSIADVLKLKSEQIHPLINHFIKLNLPILSIIIDHDDIYFYTKYTGAAEHYHLTTNQRKEFIFHLCYDNKIINIH